MNNKKQIKYMVDSFERFFFTVTTEELYHQWKAGKLYLDVEAETLTDDASQREQELARDGYTQLITYAELELFLKEVICESVVERFTSPSGDKMAAFGWTEQ